MATKRARASAPKSKPDAAKPAPAGYSGTPLPQKLGIKPDSCVALVRAPDGFERNLGELPPGACLRPRGGAGTTLAIWFLRSRSELLRDLPRIVAQAQQGPVWMAWPKLTSGVKSDLTEQIIRTPALEAGLVDYKVAALDATWSGLCFSLRRDKKA